MYTIKALLRKDKTLKDGSSPIQIRVGIKRERTYFNTKFKANPTQWDVSAGLYNKNHPLYKQKNALLKNEILKLEQRIMHIYYNNNDNFSIGLVKEVIKQKVDKNNITFTEFYKKYLVKSQKEKSIGMYEREKSVFDKLESYKKGPIKFSDLKPELFNGYIEHCKTNLKNSLNTIHSNFKVFKACINEAIRSGYINPQDNPFNLVKVKTTKTHKVYLSETELLKLASHNFSDRPNLDLYRDLFVMAVYCAGIRFSDLIQLKWSNVADGYIDIKIQKTNDQLKIKLVPEAIQIINKYKKVEIIDFKQDDQYIFPLIKIKPNEITPNSLHKRLNSANTIVNGGLKEIAKELKIDKHLSTHIARHTFATRALSKTGDIALVSKLLGHSKINQSMEYAKIASKDMDDAMEKINESTK